MDASAEDDFREFVLARTPALLGTAYALTGDRGLAEDLLQTALIKTYRHWRSIRRTTHAPDAYVRRVMVNQRISRWRRRRVAESDRPLPDRAAPEARTGIEERDELWRALRQLPPRTRAVVVLRYWEDLPEAEVAELLGCSVGSVKSQASRGLARLRDVLADRGGRSGERGDRGPAGAADHAGRAHRDADAAAGVRDRPPAGPAAAAGGRRRGARRRAGRRGRPGVRAGEPDRRPARRPPRAHLHAGRGRAAAGAAGGGSAARAAGRAGRPRRGRRHGGRDPDDRVGVDAEPGGLARAGDRPRAAGPAGGRPGRRAGRRERQGRRERSEAWVWGPDAGRLSGQSGGAAGSTRPVTSRYAIGDEIVQVRELCGRTYGVVLAAPGTTGRVYWISAITPRLRGVRASEAVPLRADGTAVFPLDVAWPRIRLERAGRVVYDMGPQSSPGAAWLPADEDVDRIAAAAPGDGKPEFVRFLASWLFTSTALPVRPSDQRVLWTGRSGRTTVILTAVTLPGGIPYVSGASTGDGAAYPGAFGGLLPPGTLERTVLAWQADSKGRLWGAYAAGGVRAEAELANGDTVPFALSGGGGVVPTPAAVVRVRVYGAGDRLIGTQTPGGGLTPVPLEPPL